MLFGKLTKGGSVEIGVDKDGALTFAYEADKPEDDGKDKKRKKPELVEK